MDSNLNQYFENTKISQKMHSKQYLLALVYYGFRYCILFIISLYNMIFIPLQMAFTIEFKGPYLMMEIFTIVTYIVDLIFIVL